MTRDDAFKVITDALGGIAPEVDLSTVDPAAELQADLDLDSMDFLNLVIAVHEATGIEIPERDYPCLATLNGFVDYLLGTSV